MKAKELEAIWQAAETEEERHQALKTIVGEFIGEIEYKIGQQMASTHAEVITILEHVQKKWNALAHRTDLPRSLYQHIIKRYDPKVYQAWMATKN